MLNILVLEQSVPLHLAISVLLLLALATLFDLRARRIPNRLVLVGLGLSLVEQGLLHGLWLGGGAWLAGCAVGMLWLWPGYLLRMVGAGDVKLMGTVGAFFGARAALQIGLASSVLGGALALLSLVLRRQTRVGWLNCKWLLWCCAQPGALASGMHRQRPELAGRLPYGLAISLGVVWVLWLSV